MMLQTAYQLTGWLSAVAFLALAVWCTPAFVRLIVGRARYYDPLKTTFLILCISRVGYSSRRIVKGVDVTVYPTAEGVLLIALSALSLIGAVFAILALRSYEKSRDGNS